MNVIPRRQKEFLLYLSSQLGKLPRDTMYVELHFTISKFSSPYILFSFDDLWKPLLPIVMSTSKISEEKWYEIVESFDDKTRRRYNRLLDEDSLYLEARVSSPTATPPVVELSQWNTSSENENK